MDDGTALREQAVALWGSGMKHHPKTVRHNTGADYRGCLIVNVLGGADLYRRIEGWWAGLVVEAKRRNP